MKYPLLVLLVSYLCGVLYFKFKLLILFPMFLVLFVIFNILRIRKAFVLFTMVPLMLVLFVLGYSLSNSKYQLQDLYFREYNNSKVILLGKVLDVYQNRSEGTTKTIVEVYSINGLEFDRRLNVSLYVDSTILSPDLNYGDRIEVLCKLSIPRHPKFTGESDLNVYSLSRNIYSTGYVTEFLNLNSSASKQMDNILGFAIFSIRKRIKDTINSQLSPEHAGVFMSILLGDRSNLPSDVMQSMSLSGITHITVVSGLHISIILGNLELLLTWLNLGRRLRNLCIIFMSLMLLIIIGPTPPVSRAVIMTIVNLMGIFFIRKSDSQNSLLIAAFIILLLNPIILFDVSFQLSFGTTAGIIFFESHIKYYLNHLLRYKNSKSKFIQIPRRYLAENISVSLSANLGIIPMLMYYMNQISLIFWLINLLISIPVQIILINGILMVLTPSFISNMLGKIVSWFISFILIVSDWGASQTYLIFNFASPNIMFFITYYIILIMVYYWNRKRVKDNFVEIDE